LFNKFSTVQLSLHSAVIKPEWSKSVIWIEIGEQSMKRSKLYRSAPTFITQQAWFAPLCGRATNGTWECENSSSEYVSFIEIAINVHDRERIRATRTIWWFSQRFYALWILKGIFEWRKLLGREIYLIIA